MRMLAKIHGGTRPHGSDEHGARSVLLDRGWRYDLEVWFFDTFVAGGRIRQLRQTILDQARLASGEALLDVGCGTGNLALIAARRLAGTGSVVGIDPAPRQLARARAKAGRAGLPIDFRSGVIESLPFDDAAFDVVTSSLMMHHLPAELKEKGLAEIRRVLKVGGRLVVADFDYADDHAHLEVPSRSGYGGTTELPRLIETAGFRDLRSEHIELPKQHRGWSGITVTTANRA